MEPSNIDEQVRRLELELATHEVQCEERWKTNFSSKFSSIDYLTLNRPIPV